MLKRTMRKIIKMDEYLAAEYLECNTYEGQRRSDDEWTRYLSRAIERGEFLTGSVALARLKYQGDRVVMVNGQHQCRAVILVGTPIDVVYEEWVCEEPTDLADLFSRYDNHKARSLSHILNPEAAALGITWKRSIIRLVVSAAAMRDDGTTQHIHKTEKKKLLRKRLNEGAFVNHLLKDGISCQHMTRAPVVRAMFDTWNKDKGIALDFWKMVKDGENLSKEHPAMVLRNYLLTTGLTKSRTAKSAIATTKEMYVKCIHGWNAYRAGKKTRLAYFQDAPVPMVV